MTAAAIPEERALRAPGGACIADQWQELDNQSFALIVSAVAGRLAAAGLSPGGVLAIMLPNRVEFVTSMFAAWRLGAAVTPVNAALTTQEPGTRSTTRARRSWSRTVRRLRSWPGAGTTSSRWPM